MSARRLSTGGWRCELKALRLTVPTLGLILVVPLLARRRLGRAPLSRENGLTTVALALAVRGNSGVLSRKERVRRPQ